jgi:hypothetical protein
MNSSSETDTDESFKIKKQKLKQSFLERDKLILKKLNSEKKSRYRRKKTVNNIINKNVNETKPISVKEELITKHNEMPNQLKNSNPFKASSLSSDEYIEICDEYNYSDCDNFSLDDSFDNFKGSSVQNSTRSEIESEIDDLDEAQTLYLNSSVELKDFLIAIYKIKSKHSLSNSAISDILCLIRLILPKPNQVPNTLNK